MHCPPSLQVQLPDMELIVNLGDWPLNQKKTRGGGAGEPLPTFSWCGSGDTWDIVWPTWDLMKSTIMGMDRWGRGGRGGRGRGEVSEGERSRG